MKLQERQEMREEPWQSHGERTASSHGGIRLRSQGGETTIGCVFESLRDDGFLLGLLLLTLPFALPFPTTMGLSTPVGVMAMLSGVALVLGRRPRIPQGSSLVADSPKPGWPDSRQSRRRPPVESTTGSDRAGPSCSGRHLRQGIGLGLISAGFALGLPLPIPFTNCIPAVAIILLCLGTILEDGLTVLLGHGVGLGAWGYLCAVGEVTWSVIHRTLGQG